MSFPEFGPFERTVLAGELPVPAYLVLLGLPTGPDTQIAIDQVQHALDAGESQYWIDALLGGRNWRPHLPAAVGHILDRRRRLSTRSLWQAIDLGSWVTPQLIVSALFSDPLFPQRVAERLDGFALPETSAEGTELRQWNRPKIVASILAAAMLVRGLSDRVPKWRTAPSVMGLLDEDLAWDVSGNIVRDWMAAALTAFRDRGIDLVPAHNTGL
jgi:hypothetical protein